MSDRIAVMNQGKLVRVGTPRELYEDPRDPFLAEFLGEANLLPGKVRAAGGVSCFRAARAEIDVGCEAGTGTKDNPRVRPEKITLHSGPGFPAVNASAGRSKR